MFSARVNKSRESTTMPKIKQLKGSCGLYWFQCPACKKPHEIGTDSRDEFPVWQFNNDLERPTIRPSVAVESRWKEERTYCHSFVTDGKIQFLDDCTHECKGMTLDLPDITKQ